MKIAICDDEQLCNDRLNNLLKTYFETKKIECYKIKHYNDGKGLIEEYTPDTFDFIFLDVDMPKMSGFKAAERIKILDPNVNIIFVTNMKEYVQRGYRYNAKAYLYKIVQQKDINDVMDLLVPLLDKYEFYRVKDIYTGRIKKIKMTDVLYFSSSDKHVIAFMGDSNDKNIEFCSKLDSVNIDLATRRFVRIHKSYLVNKRYITKFFWNRVILENGEEIPVSNSFRKVAKKAFEEEVVL